MSQCRPFDRWPQGCERQGARPRGGRGCYDSIMPKFQRLVDKRGHNQYYVRGILRNTTRISRPMFCTCTNADLTRFPWNLWLRTPKCPMRLRKPICRRYFAEYERLAKFMIERHNTKDDFNFFHFMLDLDQGPCAIKRLRGCGCGNEYVAVTPDGDVYPCHRVVGHDDWKMETCLNNRSISTANPNLPRRPSTESRICKNCWAKFYCSGGCNANNMQYKGDILKHPCIIVRA